MLTSCDGKYCSVLWPSAGVYALYATGGVDSMDSWRELGRGRAVSVAWAAGSATLALLHVPKDKVTASLPPEAFRSVAYIRCNAKGFNLKMLKLFSAAIHLYSPPETQASDRTWCVSVTSHGSPCVFVLDGNSQGALQFISLTT